MGIPGVNLLSREGNSGYNQRSKGKSNYSCIVSKIILSLGFVFFHQEVASDSFCFLINYPWLLVFVLFEFLLFLFGFNLYCWTGTHFSWSFFIIFLFHFWFRDLLRELIKKYEVLLMVIFLVFLLFLVSEALLFVSFFWISFHSLSSASLGI